MGNNLLNNHPPISPNITARLSQQAGSLINNKLNGTNAATLNLGDSSKLTADQFTSRQLVELRKAEVLKKNQQSELIAKQKREHILNSQQQIGQLNHVDRTTT